MVFIQYLIRWCTLAYCLHKTGPYQLAGSTPSRASVNKLAKASDGINCMYIEIILKKRCVEILQKPEFWWRISPRSWTVSLAYVNMIIIHYCAIVKSAPLSEWSNRPSISMMINACVKKVNVIWSKEVSVKKYLDVMWPFEDFGQRQVVSAFPDVYKLLGSLQLSPCIQCTVRSIHYKDIRTAYPARIPHYAG